MVLQRWDPFTEIRRMHDRFYRRWPGFTAVTDGAARDHWAIPLDVVQGEDSYEVRASLPGVKPEDIQVSVDHGVLTIKGRTQTEGERKEGDYVVRERRSGSFQRSLRLPDTVDADGAEPNFDNGVLTITLPKVESKRAKQLTVTVGKSVEDKKE